MNKLYKICSGCGTRLEHSQTCQCVKDKRNKNSNRNSDGFYNTKPWKRLRLKVLDRDNYICQRCYYLFNIVETQNLQAHHIKSREHYPELSLDESNIICVCRTCNLQLSTNDKLDFKWELPTEEEYEINL